MSSDNPTRVLKSQIKIPSIQIKDLFIHGNISGKIKNSQLGYVDALGEPVSVPVREKGSCALIFVPGINFTLCRFKRLKFLDLSSLKARENCCREVLKEGFESG